MTVKKYLTILLAVSLIFSLTACGGKDATDQRKADSNQAILNGQSVDEAQFGGDLLARLQEAQSAGWQEVDQSEGFGQYHTEEELLAMLESGDYSSYTASAEPPAEPVTIEAEETGGEAFTYDPGEGITGTFSEAEAAEIVKGGVTFFDWKSQMSPEDLAQWEAFDPNAPEIQAQMEEANRLGEEMQQMDEAMGEIDMDEINQQLEDAMKELEGMELPEGYEDYLPEGFDLEGLLNGLQQ